MQVKIQDSAQLQIVLAVYDQENILNNEQPSYSRLKTSVRRHVDQKEDPQLQSPERNRKEEQ